MRINKWLAQNLPCARRKADELVSQGKVFVNGKPATLGQQVSVSDCVSVDGQLIEAKKQIKTTLIYYKPSGVECTADPQTKNNIISVIDYPERLFTIGRLDKESEGLILLTNDGDLAYKMSHAKFDHEKEYEVTFDHPVNDQEIVILSQGGLEIDGRKTEPCLIKRINRTTLSIILKEGRNRQIRRMGESLGLRVLKLVRIRIDIHEQKTLRLKPGEYKVLI